MNRIFNTANQCRVLLLILFMGSMATNVASANISTEMDKKIENRILSLGFSVDARYNAEVKKRINQYINRQRKMSEILIGRSTIYFPTFEQVLRDKGLPQDLKYLSVVESGLRPAATSRIGAAGLWQFMRPTGRMMGLKINRTVDERRDIVKSTEAAADYLLKLYGQFDDWTLALAAYNCGPGNMRKAIRKSGGKRNFWEIKKYLPKETREYIPKLIAMTYVMNYYYDHDIMPTIPDENLINTSTAQVFEKIDLKTLSKELELDLSTLRTLNPSFIRNYIPKSEDGKYQLVLPTPEMRIVAAKYHVLAALPLLESRDEEVVEVDSPETRSMIEILKIPSAIYFKSNSQNTPNHVKSMYVHPVSLNDRKKKDWDTKPESYKIDQRRKSISSISKLMKLDKKTL